MMQPDPQQIPLRDPQEVMTLARMGSMHQSRLSFMRVLLRRMKGEGWQFFRPDWSVNGRGEGHAVYTAKGPERAYSLIAFAHDLPAEMRSDRVIATAWDATFVLFDGVPTNDEIDVLRANVPKQEAGRVSSSVLTLSRANRSVRLWDHVVACLVKGQQPDPEKISDVGYLMRTTAVYGSAKFGAADRAVIEARRELSAPFQAEMLTVYLIRTFVMDLVEHLARAVNPAAARLDPSLKRRFGIGNSTGLGMAPFLVNHPKLIHNWMAAREWALAQVRGLDRASIEEVKTFKSFAKRAACNATQWQSSHPIQQAKLAELRADMTALLTRLDGFDFATHRPWDVLWRWGETHLGLEGQEQLASLLLEPYGPLIDTAAGGMAADETPKPIDGRMDTSAMRTLIERIHPRALETDWDAPEACARVWYTSAEKLEPRLGERAEEDLDAYANALCPAHDAAKLYAALDGETGPIAAFLLHAPEHRHTVRRLQLAATHAYAEIRDNTTHAEMAPIDLLRAKLSFFGATRFDPRSDRWLRITMFQNAPYPEDLAQVDPDGWSYPSLNEVGA
ncbi:hypothetical protein [Jannaschia sp. CCS1]|uniref:hypothetical protein n=1 Tax=Jannaschia sp. (strain CCS1) TaxID=290400 RepID=UPI000053D94C|nr:hypothetical protein [Jannaschia sp. CCS1]ABD54520.1 hypothetical protein Jann_1603 [Jannaschia sp. CCS1]